MMPRESRITTRVALRGAQRLRTELPMRHRCNRRRGAMRRPRRRRTARPRICPRSHGTPTPAGKPRKDCCASDAWIHNAVLRLATAVSIAGRGAQLRWHVHFTLHVWPCGIIADRIHPSIIIFTLRRVQSLRCCFVFFFFF